MKRKRRRKVLKNDGMDGASSPITIIAIITISMGICTAARELQPVRLTFSPPFTNQTFSHLHNIHPLHCFERTRCTSILAMSNPPPFTKQRILHSSSPSPFTKMARNLHNKQMRKVVVPLLWGNQRRNACALFVALN